MLELLKAVLFGIVEGVTEWLPISSTGHLILLSEFVTLQVSPEFQTMFDVVIQLGAILAVVVLFFYKLNPLARGKTPAARQHTWQLWAKVIVSILPSGIVGIALDDWMEEHLYNAYVVALALIVYGVAFLVVEKRNQGKSARIQDVQDIDYRTALAIGCFQCLSLIPGTSRSGSTILGAIILGVNRAAGAHAGRQRHQAAEVPGLGGQRHRSGAGDSGRGLRYILPGEPSGDQGADGIRAQALLQRLWNLPHRPGRSGAALFQHKITAALFLLST